jgi:hypothetical protein
VARRIESLFPQLNDSLASAMEFLGQEEADVTAGSAQLRRLVVSEAESAVEGLPLDEVIDRRPLHRAATWFGIAAAVLALCVILDAAAVRTALARLAPGIPQPARSPRGWSGFRSRANQHGW